jgi:sugar (pentulose or hexulose) kinase
MADRCHFEPELTAIGAALIATQGATGPALPFGARLNLRKIEPVVAWIEPYAELYQDYRARLDATKAQ